MNVKKKLEMYRKLLERIHFTVVTLKILQFLRQMT